MWNSHSWKSLFPSADIFYPCLPLQKGTFPLLGILVKRYIYFPFLGQEYCYPTFPTLSRSFPKRSYTVICGPYGFLISYSPCKINLTILTLSSNDTLFLDIGIAPSMLIVLFFTISHREYIKTAVLNTSFMCPVDALAWKCIYYSPSAQTMGYRN